MGKIVVAYTAEVSEAAGYVCVCVKWVNAIQTMDCQPW